MAAIPGAPPATRTNSSHALSPKVGPYPYTQMSVQGWRTSVPSSRASFRGISSHTGAGRHTVTPTRPGRSPVRRLANHGPACSFIHKLAVVSLISSRRFIHNVAVAVWRASDAGLPTQNSTPGRFPELRTADRTWSTCRSIATSSASPGPPLTAIGGLCRRGGCTAFSDPMPPCTPSELHPALFGWVIVCPPLPSC